MQMKFVVKKACCSGGRVGALELGSCPKPIETPALLLSTRKGLPHFIAPDLLTSLPFPDSHLLQISPLHFLEGLASTTISKIGGLHQMLSLHQYGIAAVARDSIQCLPESKGATKLGPSFETPCGRLSINPKDYVEMISCMRPNIWATLADEVPAWVSEKRNKTSVDRTVRWLDDCLALNPAAGSVFGAVVGGPNFDERKRCALEVAKRNVSGYWIGGFGLGERIEERPALLSAIIDVLPDEKPRMISGLGLPEEILEGIDAGIDLFDSTKDMSPILGNCTCYTCRNHTKAYINHLFNVHEMLAQTLLEIHNTHHYLMFFRVIREAIKDGRFKKFRMTFIESRRVHQETEADCA
ncbi:queuine tRNA-ribosyltransferase accessory subunit 2 isoform X3 [Vigna radiata var. radiata]|uniref:Queuine tRNA-ribosyltransferase accessory subunit 2 n=1 Tax=Vigna radiata var. radiata TaxID=3916 RepID=A0A1S3VSD2_VIGRR|nr:queuine tRNA-ribosyltransferase accessory subunit 2 isoform X3 [Vigna radiata var. radiata]